MGSITTYFKIHPWQRRVIVIILVVIAGSIVGRLTYPWYLQHQRQQKEQTLIEQLGDADPYQRELAVQKMILQGEKHPEMAKQLFEALSTPDDGQFLSLYYILQRLEQLQSPAVDPKWLDRYQLLEFKATFAAGEDSITPSAQENETPTGKMRRWHVRQALLSTRDNEYIRQLLSLALNDPYAGVRQSAAPLAARLGDDAALETLLRDPSAAVRSVAALDAGLANRTALAAPIRAQFESLRNLMGPPSPDTLDQIASAAYALALLDPAGCSEMLCRAAAESVDQPELHTRLLLVLAVLNDAAAVQTVQDLLHANRWLGRQPNGVLLYVAGLMQLPEATEISMDVLRAIAAKKQSFTTAQALAAVNVVLDSGYPCRAVAYDICRDLWQPGAPVLFRRVAKLLGEQAAVRQLGEAPSKAACIETLQNAALYSAALENPGSFVTTPMPSAAAAVALWKLAPADREFPKLDESNDSKKNLDREAIVEIVESKTSLYFLRETLVADDPAACDYVAWCIGRSGQPQAADAARAFLPKGKNKNQPPEYNASVRSCGAMILALSANNRQQRKDAIERISQQLEREEYPAAGSLRCALLMAGQTDQLKKVRTLLEMEDFPAARALMALLVAGDKTTLDWLLWNTNWNLPVPLQDISPLLIDQVIGEVLQTVAPELPAICPVADNATQLWLARILRQSYGINKASIRVGLRNQ